MEEEIVETVETAQTIVEGADISPLDTVGSEVAEQTSKFFHIDELNHCHSLWHLQILKTTGQQKVCL